MLKSFSFIPVVMLIITAGCKQGFRICDEQSYTHSTPHKVFNVADFTKIENQSPENVIIMIGDGMGPSHVLAAEITNGGVLNMTQSKHVGLVQTSSFNSFVTDSAAAATAIATGVKVPNKQLAINHEYQAITSLFKIAKENSYKTGVVTTCSITHATPAAFLVHHLNRYENRKIASKITTAPIDIAVAGGSKYFDQSIKQKLKNEGFDIIYSLESVLKYEGNKMLGLVSEEHPVSYPSRGDYLSKATNKAIELLDKIEEPFLLVIEGSQIDWASHDRNLEYMINEVLDFDRAVGEALKYVSQNTNTLLLVTADHETGGIILTNGNSDKQKISAKFTTSHHTGEWVPLYAFGAGSRDFSGVYQNTSIFDKIVRLLDLKKENPAY